MINQKIGELVSIVFKDNLERGDYEDNILHKALAKGTSFAVQLLKNPKRNQYFLEI